MAPGKRHAAGERRGLRAGKDFKPGQDLPIEIDDLLLVTSLGSWEPDSHRQQVLGVEAGVHVMQTDQAVEKQSGADQQYQSESELGHYKHTTQSLPAKSAATSFFERIA